MEDEVARLANVMVVTILLSGDLGMTAGMDNFMSVTHCGGSLMFEGSGEVVSEAKAE